MRKIMFGIGSVLLPVVGVFADAPIDMTTTGSTLAGYIATAAGCALAIFAGLYGIRVIIRAFKAVK